ncbi:MAG: DUF58 domain-containing protein [Myxococcales bacterium]|nr:DUF58 domain-containing protein [Myxococcales bacterium]
MRARWARWKALARRAADLFPLTWLGGVLLTGAVLAVAHFGLARFDLVLLGMGMLGVVLVGLSALSAVVGTIRLRRWLRAAQLAPATTPLPFEAECGTGTWSGFEVPAPRMPFITVAWDWAEPSAGVRLHRLRGHVREEAFVNARCEANEIVRRVEIRDAFGLACVRWTVREARAVCCLPQTGALREFRVVRSLAGGDALSFPEAPQVGERVDMRRYVAGDPIRFVLWKVYARTRELMVRTPERAIAPVDQTVAYLVAGDEDEASAGAARVALEMGALGTNWVFGADGSPTYATERSAAHAILARSGMVPAAEGGAGLHRFLRTATHGPVGRAVLFVPAKAGPWLERVQGALRGFGAERMNSPVEVVLAVDGVRTGAKASWFRRLAFRAPSPELADWATTHVDHAALRGLLAELAGLASRVTVLDRTTGRATETEEGLSAFETKPAFGPRSMRGAA